MLPSAERCVSLRVFAFYARGAEKAEKPQEKHPTSQGNNDQTLRKGN
jgi:hypothetical protein